MNLPKVARLRSDIVQIEFVIILIYCALLIMCLVYAYGD